MGRLKKCIWYNFDKSLVDYREYHNCLKCKHLMSQLRVCCRINRRTKLGNNVVRFICNYLNVKRPIRVKACIKAVYLIYTRELQRELLKNKSKRKSKNEVIRSLYW